MLQRKNKKGFTLAELLIVVAIIAVLTAIAVPLFVGAIDDAKSATKDANVRVVRGAAVIAILENQDTYRVETYKTIKNTSGTLTYDQAAAAGQEYAWYVTADISASGDISNLKVYATAAAAKTAGYDDLTGGKDSSIKEEGTGYKVVVLITEDKLTVAA